MSYTVKGFWSGASESDYDTLKDAEKAALEIITTHKGASATVEGPDVIVNYYGVWEAKVS